jgi:hypothetical protein
MVSLALKCYCLFIEKHLQAGGAAINYRQRLPLFYKGLFKLKRFIRMVVCVLVTRFPGD